MILVTFSLNDKENYNEYFFKRIQTTDHEALSLELK